MPGDLRQLRAVATSPAGGPLAQAVWAARRSRSGCKPRQPRQPRHPRQPRQQFECLVGRAARGGHNDAFGLPSWLKRWGPLGGGLTCGVSSGHPQHRRHQTDERSDPQRRYNGEHSGEVGVQRWHIQTVSLVGIPNGVKRQRGRASRCIETPPSHETRSPCVTALCG